MANPVLPPVTTGNRYGRLTVLSFSHRVQSQPLWNCLCDCGNHKLAYGSHLKRGVTKSCGCHVVDIMRVKSTKHGHAANGSRSNTYTIWCGLKQRCLDPGYRNASDYSERGITVCERWAHSFEAFLDDMGERPSSKHSIERKDNNGPYSPENCIWATSKEQARNRRSNRLFTIGAETKCLSEWAESTSGTSTEINRWTLWSRIDRGWDIERAISTPIDARRRRRSERV